jgi:hypothetical protein
MVRATEAIATSRVLVDDAQRRMRLALDLVFASQKALVAPTPVRAELREAAEAYARLLHGEGVSPEHMLVRVKETVLAARDGASTPAGRHEFEVLMQDLVTWSIDAYYAA